MNKEIKETRKTQKAMVLAHLKRGWTLTPKQADEKWGVMRLAAIICDLRKAGYEIETRECVSKNKLGGVSNYAKYKLIKSPIDENPNKKKLHKKGKK